MAIKQFKDGNLLDSSQVFDSITNTTIDNKIKNIVETNIMMINLNDRQNITTTTETKINFNNVVSQVGDKLAFSNNGIKIGKGISYVKVSYSLWVEPQDLSYCAGYIYKNSTAMTYNITPSGAINGSTWRTLSVADILIPVAENDIIYVYARFNNASATNSIAGTYQKSCNMTVEAVQ